MTVVSDGHGVCVFADGELDHGTAATFSDRLVQVVAMGRSPIVVDLSGVSFADVAGYRAMTRFGECCSRRGVVNVWVRPGSTIELLWRILGHPGGTVQQTPWNGVAASAN
jgi:anti-anti-sigma factor